MMVLALKSACFLKILQGSLYLLYAYITGFDFSHFQVTIKYEKKT